MHFPFPSHKEENKMKKSAIVIITGFLALSQVNKNFAEDRKTDILSKEKQQQPIPLSQVQLSGELGVRYMAAMCNILNHSERYSLESFDADARSVPGALWWDWPGDQIGRWLSVVHVAEGSNGWPSAAAYRKAVADTVFPHQTQDGYFGKPGTLKSDDSRIPSGNAFCLRGMMDAYADTHDPRYLESARKLAHYFETIAPIWETSQVEIFDRSGQKQSFDVNNPHWDKREKGKLHEFYGHCIDGLVALYEQAGDQFALDLAKRLASRFARTPHTHHTLSICRGLIDLARVTGDKQYLDKVEDYLAWCRENQLVTGGLPEAMPVSPQDEGCGLADWIVVNLMMYQLTGEERYVDDAEHTLVNHFFMNQFHTGGFGHRTFSQEIVGGKLWQGWDGQFGSENPGCCSFWGAWALGQLSQYVVTQTDNTISVNLYPTAEIKLPDRGVRLEISSDFPRMHMIHIRVECEKPQTFTMVLRIPPWSEFTKVKCEGVVVKTPINSRRVLITREWKNVTNVDIEFENEFRAVSWPIAKPKGIAVFKGPMCYGLSSRLANVDLDWSVLVRPNGEPFPDGEGRPQVLEVSNNLEKTLEPINANWLVPDEKNPTRYRILFQAVKM